MGSGFEAPLVRGPSQKTQSSKTTQMAEEGWQLTHHCWAHFGQRGPGCLRRVDGEESRSALPGWTRRQKMGEGRRPSSKLKISRRRIVSSGDYGDFVVSNSRRESFSDYNVRSFVTTSSDYGRFLSGTSLVTGALLRRARPIVDRLATDCSDYGFYPC